MKMTKKSKKRALISSLVVMAICFTMLIGSTFAWFTDSASSTGNTITTGTLDIKLTQKNAETGAYDEVTGPVFDNVLWEPNATYVEYFRIENFGSLALKFGVALDVTNVTKNLNEVLEYAVVEGDTVAGWTSGTAVAVGNNVTTIDNITLAPQATYDFALVIHMDHEAGNTYQDATITFDVNVAATQATYESDSFGDQYDADAPSTLVATKDELATALTTGGTVKLQNDITGVDANTAITVAKGTAVNLDLNGHKITASANKTGNQELFLVKGDMTVTNGTIEFVAENNQGWSSMATVFDVTDGGSLKIDGVTANVSGTDMNFFVHLNNWGTASLEMTNCDITTTYAAVRAFNSGYDMNTVTIKDTDFHTGRVFWVHCYTAEGADDSTLTLDIYGNNNTTDNAKPVRFGFDNALYYDIDGNLIP